MYLAYIHTWPQTPDSSCLGLPRAGRTSVQHYFKQGLLILFIKTRGLHTVSPSYVPRLSSLCLRPILPSCPGKSFFWDLPVSAFWVVGNITMCHRSIFNLILKRWSFFSCFVLFLVRAYSFRPDLPRTHCHPPASASQALRLQMYATTFSWLYFWSYINPGALFHFVFGNLV